MKPDVEIEIKLPLSNKNEIIQKLEKIGARFINKKHQTDLLFNSEFAHFEKYDKALRLRSEAYEDESHKELLAFKGTPQHTKLGHKIRDEYESIVNFDKMHKILYAIGFKEEIVVKKIRQTYAYRGLEIAIDELVFGIFLEIEGKEKDIEIVRSKLGLQNIKPVAQGYAHLQREFEKKSVK